MKKSVSRDLPAGRTLAKGESLSAHRGEIGQVKFFVNGQPSLTRVYSDERAMLGETMFNAWVCMAAGGSKSGALKTEVSHDLFLWNQERLKSLDERMTRIADMSGPKTDFKVHRNNSVLFCGGRGFYVFDGVPRRGQEPKFSCGVGKAAVMSFAAKTKDKSVVAYRGYDDLEDMASQAEFLAEVIEARWPGELAASHKLTITLDEAHAHRELDLKERLGAVSPMGVDVGVDGRWSFERGSGYPSLATAGAETPSASESAPYTSNVSAALSQYYGSSDMFRDESEDAFFEDMDRLPF